MRAGLFALCLWLAAWTGTAAAHWVISPQASGSDARLRGISAVSNRIAWASGQRGTVLRTLDGGAHWQRLLVAGAEALDFRDIEAFDAKTAVVLAIGPGEASRIYRTEDGGVHWQLVLQNRDPRGFFDCMAFAGQRGAILGDPVDGRWQLWQTDDGGRQWQPVEDAPQALAGEAAFAASGSCIAAWTGGIALGSGGEVARVQTQAAPGGSWQPHDSGMGRKLASAGVFSLARSGRGLIAVGGDYRQEMQPGNAWRLRGDVAKAAGAAKAEALPAPPGYRSGIACVRDALPCIAVGPGGVDLWDGKRWRTIAGSGYDAIDFAGSTGWMSGADGRIAIIEATR